VQFNCVKKLYVKPSGMFSDTAQVSYQVCQFFVSSVCLLVRVSSRCLQVLRELWDSPSKLRSSVCERRLERTVLRLAVLPVQTAKFNQFFPSVMT
jgi:hypothetical protein